MTSIDPECTAFEVNVRYGSNTQENFYDCVKAWMQGGALREGDFLVMDNAAVHTGTTLGMDLTDLFKEFGVTPVTLPTYSPELNPCELVFARMKSWIRSVNALHTDERTNREVVVPFDQIIRESLSQIDYDELVRMYKHCERPEYM